jgi:hypothetical protein
MKFEINDTVIIIILILMGILVLGLLIMLIYYKLEKRLKENLQLEIEGKKSAASPALAKKLGRAGILERQTNKFELRGVKSQQKGFDSFSDPSKRVMIISGRENLVLSSTSRYQPTMEGDNHFEQADSGPRLNLDDTKDAAEYIPQVGGRVPTENDFWQPRRRKDSITGNQNQNESSTNHDGNMSKLSSVEIMANQNNTMDRIKNFRIDDLSVNDVSLDKSGIKSPKLTTFNIQYKAEAGSQNVFHFSGSTSTSKES